MDQLDLSVLITKQGEQLTYQSKRMDLLEEAVGLLRDEFTPAKKHVEFVNSLCKLFTAIIAVSGGILGIMKLLGHL